MFSWFEWGRDAVTMSSVRRIVSRLAIGCGDDKELRDLTLLTYKKNSTSISPSGL